MLYKLLFALVISISALSAMDNKQYKPMLIAAVASDKQAVNSPKDLYTPLLITSLLNDSKQTITIQNAQYTAEVTATKQVSFDKPFNIPFISIALYIKDFAEAAQGKLFIPKGALSILFGNKRYGIWENEMGIMCSTDTKSSENEIGFIKLMKNINKHGAKDKQAVAKALCYLLSINNQGAMVLGNATIK